MSDAAGTLSLFHPTIAAWFRERVGTPTEIQHLAWPVIARGEHALITAPTGSGKTLTAFLYALDRLLTGDWPGGGTRVLYISPLKALNNDIQRNLIDPLAQLQRAFSDAGIDTPEVNVLTRSGDTPQSARRTMLRRPPEILITTPESLGLMLTTEAGTRALQGVRTLILDEIHAVTDSKRGSHLMASVERLAHETGEFQRVALSATVKPLDVVARLVGGYTLTSHDAPAWSPRDVTLVRATTQKTYDVKVRVIDTGPSGEGNMAVWGPIAEDLRERVTKNRSTLIFTNTRALCEKLCLLINDGAREPIAYAHHGSLSREIRFEVEQRLKSGRLAAIVATSSLELGIDIGSVDEVVLVQSPNSIASSIQRVGRAGHQVGQVSHGVIVPTNGRDCLEAAVLAEAIAEHDVEPMHVIDGPLDVLAQVVVSMVAVRAWDIDCVFNLLRCATPFHHVSRQVFELVLDMLAGRYHSQHLRELRGRVVVDRDANTISARKGARFTVLSSGGTIPDRGQYALRHAVSRARIGELDEEFVWEAKPGDTFTLGAQAWRIERITHNDVFVIPGSSNRARPPFWRGEELDRDWHLSDRLGRFLEDANDRVDDDAFEHELLDRFALNPLAAERLVAYLRNQRGVTGSALPHRHHILAEFVDGPAADDSVMPMLLHAPWGGRVVRPLALALGAAWEERAGHRVEVFCDNDVLHMTVPRDFNAADLFEMVTADNLDGLLRRAIEGSGFFGARFRETAGRALLITRGSPGKRLPLWVSRRRSQKLLASVLDFDDFPVLLETWRTCLRDEFDLPQLRVLLDEVRTNAIALTIAHTRDVSPFGASMQWRMTNKYMYLDDTPAGRDVSNLRDDLLRDVVFQADLRPTLPRALIAAFEAKRQRTAPGYAPTDAVELYAWLRERLLIPQDEWDALLAAAARDGAEHNTLLADDKLKAASVLLPGGAMRIIIAVDDVGRLAAALGVEVDRLDVQPTAPQSRKPKVKPRSRSGDGDDADLEQLFAQWLTGYGPVDVVRIAAVWGLDGERIDLLVAELAEDRAVAVGSLSDDAVDTQVCDSENLEALLRMLRAASRSALEPLPVEQLAPFLAAQHSLDGKASSGPLDRLRSAIDALAGHPAPAAAWERDLLPARVPGYTTSYLDTLMQESDLMWLGVGRQKVTLTFPDEVSLLAASARKRVSDDVEALLADEHHSATVESFASSAGKFDTARLTKTLWQAAWRGEVTNSTFVALRTGIESDFKPAPITSDTGRRASRSGMARWKASRPFAGQWRRVPQDEGDDDQLEQVERSKDRVRLLLERHGILFRELLERELAPLRWGRVFRALRIMELAGEVVGGHFFEGIPGPQFASPAAVSRIERGVPYDTVYWLSATDPASLAGVKLDALRGTLPRRVPGNHLVYHGAELVLVSKRSGRDLSIHVAPDHLRLADYFAFMRHLLTRSFQPVQHVAVEKINGRRAGASEYVDVMRTLFDITDDYREIKVWKRIVR